MEDRILPTRSGESVVFMGGTLENGWHVGMQGMQGQAYRQESRRVGTSEPGPRVPTLISFCWNGRQKILYFGIPLPFASAC